MARSRDEHVVFAADGDIVVVPVALIGASPPKSPDEQEILFEKTLVERRNAVLAALAKKKEEERKKEEVVGSEDESEAGRDDVFWRGPRAASKRVLDRASLEISGLTRKFSRLSRGSPANSPTPSPSSPSPFPRRLHQLRREAMSSPLAHKSTNGTTQALSLRNSTFAPANLGDIPRMNTSAELSSLADATSSSTETEKKPIQDYGYFRTGTVQYGHAHWKNKDQVTSNAAPTGTQSDMQLTVDPSTLQSDADSIRIKICNNASSNSVNTKLSSSPKSDITGRRLPQAQQSALNKTSITQDNSTPQTVASENVGRPEITEQSEDTESSKKQEKQENIPPVPVDIRDHPSNFQTPTQQVDPFRTVTESRVLSAQWRAAEVQQGTNGQDSMFDYRHRPQNDHIMRVVSNSDAEDQIISIHEAAFEGPADATESTNPKTPTSRKSFTGSWGKARATTRSSTPATDTSKRSTPAGVRSISNLFRTRTSQESERFSGDKFQKDRELYLRTMTCTLPNANISMYPKHPNTNRPWMHKNLRCTNCTDKWCSRCKRACCAYKAAVEGAKNHPSGPNHHRALGHAEEIGKFRKYGTELPTFMKCTDCEEMFCPDCCGECADPQCRLVCCRGCKSDPWVNCDFHENH